MKEIATNWGRTQCMRCGRALQPGHGVREHTLFQMRLDGGVGYCRVTFICPRCHEQEEKER